ncbi:MAG: lactate racemase domain-containing protein [Clostridia bacterium]|nr:lactate racemase domain-containing protein [Clostridia bacterium]
MPILLEKDLKRRLPAMYKARQVFEKVSLGNVEEVIRKEIYHEEIREKVKPQMKIAVGVGSRGITNIAVMVKTTIDCLKEMGADPFIVSAMGSHGGGEPEGQRQILSDYGITEKAMGVGVVTDVDVVVVGKTVSGSSVYFDRAAYNADMTIVINRIKPHTEFNGVIESGLCKMLVIGLGNQIGCSRAHEKRPSEMGKSIEESVKVILKNTNFGFGIGIVEDSFHNTAELKVIPSDKLLQEEPKLLMRAKELMAKLFFPEIDVLIIEQIGKNISGTGADPNVIGRVSAKKESSFVPRIQNIVILDLTKETHGVFTGLGLGDVTTKKVFNKLDFEKTYANEIAARSEKITSAIPIVMESEREAIIAAMVKCFDVENDQYKIVRIQDTMNLEEIMISEALLPFAKQSNKIELY